MGKLFIPVRPAWKAKIRRMVSGLSEKLGCKGGGIFGLRPIIGGPETFMRLLTGYLDAAGYDYSRKETEAGVIFHPVGYDHKVERLARLKGRGIKVISRFDGVFYPRSPDDGKAEKNEVFRKVHSELSHHVVYQSEYVKKQCRQMLGALPEERTTVILNGTDKKVFYPAGDHVFDPEHVSFVTTGSFRSNEMLEPLIKALDALAGEFGFELMVAGPVVNKDLKKFLDRSYVRLLGPLDGPGVSDVLREADIFLFSQLNAPCPNAVIEAVSCGLPVVSFDSGSMRELLPFGRDLLARVSDELFQAYSDFSPVKLAEKIKLAVSDYPRFRERALDNASLYDFSHTGAAYVRVFDNVRGSA